MDQAGSPIRASSWSYKQFLSHFRNVQSTRGILDDDDVPDIWEYEKEVELGKEQKIGIATAFEMSLRYLGEGKHGQAKRHLLILAAHMDSSSVSRAVFLPWLNLVSGKPAHELSEGHVQFCYSR